MVPRQALLPSDFEMDFLGINIFYHISKLIWFVSAIYVKIRSFEHFGDARKLLLDSGYSLTFCTAITSWRLFHLKSEFFKLNSIFWVKSKKVASSTLTSIHLFLLWPLIGFRKLELYITIRLQRGNQ